MGEQTAATEWVTSFQAGHGGVRVVSSDAALVHLVESLFADLPALTAEAQASVVEMTPEAGDLVGLRIDGREVEPQPVASALATLCSAVSRISLDADPSSLHVHAAGLTHGDAGLMMCAESGAGKTTLSAALTKRGWAYITDEAIALDPDTGRAAGFNKPLVFKPDTRVQVGVEDCALDVESAGPAWTFVRASDIGDTADVMAPTAIVILLPQAAAASAETAGRAQSMHPADATVALMTQTMDADRFGARTVPALAELAARCSCATMVAGPLETCLDEIEALVGTPSTLDQVEEVRRAADSVIEGWAIREDVQTILVGGRAVIHDTKYGAIAALDDAGTAVWLALLGRPPAWFDPTDAGPQLRPFFIQLAERQFVLEVDGQPPMETR